MKLIIEDDEGRRTVVPVVRDEITIGRNDANNVRLTEKNVSRKHGRLLREEGHFYIEDLNSFTGIRVNGEKISGKHVVHEGDLIQISEYDLTLQAGPDEKKPGEGASLGSEDDEPTAVRKEASPEDAAKAEAQAQADAEKRKMAETATIRLSDLKPAPEAEAAPREVSEALRPKLVGISGTYRGKELSIARTPVRIGRSDENEISIDHPSISRKHLRLHLADGSWKVMDAESRNGVRVNGEPYAQIGLKHGDVIEIGHLRFAFVEPGKLFKLPAEFAPMAPGMGPVQPARGKGLYVGIGMAIAAVVGAAVFVVMEKRRGSEDEGVEAAQGPKAERKFALRSAEEALAAHRYTEALRNLDIARRDGASADELKSYNTVQNEARSEDLYREMEAAASSQDWERARKLLNVLTSTPTWFGAKASGKSEAITAGYVNLHIAAAALMKGKDNQGCIAEAHLALQANPSSADAQSLMEACKAPTPAAAAPVAARSAPAPRQQAATAAAGRGADDSTARQLVNDGNQKLIASDYPSAIAQYQKALALRPSDAVLGGIYRSMGIAFTRQGNVEEGARYYKLYLPLCTNPAEKAQLKKVLDDYEARRR